MTTRGPTGPSEAPPLLPEAQAAGPMAGAREARDTPEPAAGPTVSQTRPAAPRPRRRWLKVLALAIPATVLAAGLLALGAYLYVLSHISVGTGERRVSSPAFGWPLRVVDRVNVLIIGVDVTLDNRRRVLNVARADTLVLVTFDPERRQVGAVSIPRDTRASIPGHGETKINASYAYGGPRLTIKTVESLVGVKIDDYVKLGPESFARFIDAVGCIDIDVEKDMKYTDSWAGYTIDLKKGRHCLTGQQAAGYIRFRHDALGDIGRVERQRKVLLALLMRLREPRVVLAAPALLKAFADNTQTTLTTGELMALGLFVARHRESPLQMQTLPGGFAPLYWEPDVPKIRALVADLFYGTTADALARMPVEVVNASGNPALGQRVAERVAALGFRSVKVRSSGEAAVVTTVIDRTGRVGAGRMILTALGRAVIRREPAANGPSITIVVARDAQYVSGRLLPQLGRVAPEGVPHSHLRAATYR